ncbi:hypothetical protein SCFA_120022 [anaerobic digester metagenome]|uniref:Uncharacterized protein n=1 Tax=anaerobic digester metagenome TaxID=1263854 RepID=A0A485LUV8_9ZZZZ
MIERPNRRQWRGRTRVTKPAENSVKAGCVKKRKWPGI